MFDLAAPFHGISQPPSGGCVLKQIGLSERTVACKPAAFRRLCVETIITYVGFDALMSQPPSGGCVLKLENQRVSVSGECPAAFRRLCVETGKTNLGLRRKMPAAFRRLCVETKIPDEATKIPETQPPSGGCVLKLKRMLENQQTNHPAAFRRLCVETRKERIEKQRD